ncbi:MAG: hypothetical protein AAF799_31875 [Myxococcota bacterium]
MSRSRYVPSPLVAALALCLAPFGCRFKSVSPVSASIEATAVHSDAIDLSESLCLLGTALASDAPACDDQSARVEALQLAVGQLSSYGGRLSKLSGIRPVNLGPAPGAVIGLGEAVSGSKLDGIERRGIQAASKILANVITTAVKRKALRTAVHDTDRSVQCLAWRGYEATEVWRREVARIAESGTKAEALDIALGAPPRPAEPPPPPPAAVEPSPTPPSKHPLAERVAEVEQKQAELEGALHEAEQTRARAARKQAKTDRRALESQRLALRSAQVIAAEHDRRLAALQRGLWSVAVSHNHLACNRDRLGTTKDRALQAELGQLVACVLERDSMDSDRSSGCRSVLARAEWLRAHACEQLHQLDDAQQPVLDDDGNPVPAAPRCSPPPPPPSTPEQPPTTP